MKVTTVEKILNWENAFLDPTFWDDWISLFLDWGLLCTLYREVRSDLSRVEKVPFQVFGCSRSFAGSLGVEDLPDCKAAQSLSGTATLWKWRKCEHFPRRRNNIQSCLEEETFGVECWSCRCCRWSWSCCWSKEGSTLSHCSHPETSAALLFSQICLKYIWNWQILYLWPHPGTATALLYGSERIFGGEILVVFSQIWNWPNIIVINYSHKWRHPGIFIVCSIVTQMNCFVQLMCYLFCQKIGMEKKSCKFSTVLQVCGRIWGPSRIEINVSTAGKWPQFSENAILWSLNARTHTHCVWKF